jgi:hypothetical protein
MSGVPIAPPAPPPMPNFAAPPSHQQRASTSVQLHPAANRGSISSNGAISENPANAANANHHSSGDHDDAKEGAASGDIRLLLDGKEANFADHLWVCLCMHIINSPGLHCFLFLPLPERLSLKADVVFSAHFS